VHANTIRLDNAVLHLVHCDLQRDSRMAYLWPWERATHCPLDEYPGLTSGMRIPCAAHGLKVDEGANRALCILALARLSHHLCRL
jgi:hypothetical protein